MAQFDLSADVSAPSDIDQHSIKAPDGEFKFVIRKVSTVDDTGAVIFHCNMEFEAPSFDHANTVAKEHIARVLNILALVTHASLEFQRIHKIFDWSPDKAVRRGFVYVYDPPEGEPEKVSFGNLHFHIMEIAPLACVIFFNADGREISIS